MMKNKDAYLKAVVTVGAVALVGIFVQNQLLLSKLKKKRKYYRNKYFAPDLHDSAPVTSFDK
ncbi:hypothetical protein I2I11_14020 [Pontibacter sp. 172403-2]|uniref:hypothetical protein n=1 Tax=Pontibacter rufus TaxID=2791028 RepID=UPI0018AF898E|nr:hypothetical protein [Pontibacter sp. 172403-2]MBF9254416.1 hypothetical protein [Pontibacter sp. 172403-2]